MRTTLKYLFLLVSIILSNNLSCFAANSINEVSQLVEKFCSQEYAGVLPVDRDQIIKYTPSAYKELQQIMEEYPYMVYIESDPLFIVDQYKIVDIKQTDSTHAYATVNYHQLASTTGSGDDISSPDSRKFIKDVRDITIKLNLEYDGKRWWIIDPPYPKVSYDVMVKYYSKEASDTYLYMTGKKGMPLRKSTAKEIARFTAVYNYEKTILDFLISLKK